MRAAGGPNTGTQAELSMASSGPSIVITFNGGPNGSGFVTSVDGGLTFSANASPPVPMGAAPCCDSGVAADLVGRFYFLQLFRNDGAGNCTNSLHVSTDGGRNFGNIVGSPFSYASGTTDFPDMPHIAIDRVNLVGGQPQLYVFTRHFTSGINCPQTGGGGATQGEVVCSTNGGAAWTAPIVLAPFTDNAHFATGSDGSVYLVGNGTGTAMGTTRILLRRSTADCNAGLALGGAVTVADNLTFGPTGIDREFPHPYVVVDRLDPNVAYVAWSSDRLQGDNDRDIFLARCGFVGTAGTCDPPVRVNDNPIADNTAQYFPMMCMDPNNVVNLSWNDQRAGGNSTAILHAEVTATGPTLAVGSNFVTSEINFVPFNFGGAPDYGDYNENNDACDANHSYAAWTSHVSPPGITPASNDPDVFFAVINNLQDIRVNAPLDFGDVCLGDFKVNPLEIFNVGDAFLTVEDVRRESGDTDISIESGPALPSTLAPGGHLDFTVRCEPTNFGASLATIRVESDDPDDPQLDFIASCNTPPPTATNSGDLAFGPSCIGDALDRTVQICDTGACNLTVTDVALVGPDCDDLSIVSPLPTDLPLVISPDFCFDFVVRFTPDDLTPPDCRLEVDTSDPSSPTLVFPVSATTGAPELVIDPPSLEGIYAFPATVADPTGTLGCFSERIAVLRNPGTCPLTISGVSATAPFSVVAPTLFPVLLPPGEETLQVVVRFEPAGGGSATAPDEETGTLTVTSDAPSGPLGAALCGEGLNGAAVRILTQNGAGTPISGLDRIELKSKGINTPSPISIVRTKVPVSSANVCSNLVRYHLSVEGLPSTETTGANPNGSYTAREKEGSKQQRQSYRLGQCEFKGYTVTLP